MSKKSKSQSKEKRKKAKATRKAAERAKYEGYKAKGQNTKSKRVVLAGKRSKRVKMQDHPKGDCGNVGCLRCSGLSGATFPLGHRGYVVAARFGLLQQFLKMKKAEQTIGLARAKELVQGAQEKILKDSPVVPRPLNRKERRALEFSEKT